MSNKTPLAKSNVSGFGLLDVLITIAILSIALLALGGLHGMIIKSSGMAKNRAVATSLAQEKLDDLRSFQELSGDDNTTIQVFGFDEIAPNNGGEENASETPILPSANNLTIGNVTYARSWDVECYYYNAAGSAATAAACATGQNRPDFKRVTATITWEDPLEPGVTQSLILQAAVSRYAPTTTGMAGLTGGEFAKPIVKYTPGQAPDIIRIDVGGGSYKEATKPQPDLQNQGTNTLTSFDEVTYNNYITTADTLERDSYFTVNCTCEFAGAGEGYKPTVYDATEDKFIVGEKVTKMTGVPTDNQQPESCNICCRDHHDSTQPPSSYSDYDAYDEVYDPFRSQNDYRSSSPSPNKNHKHYFDTSNNNTALEAKDEDTGQKYYEACKMVRVDGYLHVAQDWRMESLQVIPGLKLDEAGEISSYTTYVKDFVKAYVLGINSSSYPQTTPSPTTSSDAFDWAPTPITNTKHYYTMTPGVTSGDSKDDQNFVARAIYMDYISPELLHILKCKINDNGYATTYCTNPKIDPDPSYLSYVPFHEVNVTRLAAWTADPNIPDDGTGSTVDTLSGSGFNDPITQQAESTYVRGRVHVLENGHAVVKVSMKRSNTGLLPPQLAIDDKEANTPDTRTDKAYLEDIIHINPVTIAPKVKITGTITATQTVNLSGPEILSVNGGGGATCTGPSEGTGNTAVFSCTLDASDGTITFGNFTGDVCTGSGKNKVCTKTYDNCLVPTGNISPSSASTGGTDGTVTETAIYSFTNVGSDKTFNVEVKHAPNASCRP